MIVAVGSKNKAKVKAVKDTFHELGIDADILPVDAPSNVSAMPFSDEETMKGAIHRAEYCLENSDAKWAIGLEGGVTETPFGLFLCNWGALAARGKTTLLAGGARILLPEEIAGRLRGGEELGPVMDDYANKTGISLHEGAIGIFTNGRIDRSDMFSHIVKLLIGQREKKNGECSS
jgi:inosine/xanthosine triphosphatase